MKKNSFSKARFKQTPFAKYFSVNSISVLVESLVVDVPFYIMVEYVFNMMNIEFNAFFSKFFFFHSRSFHKIEQPLAKAEKKSSKSRP